MEPLIFTAHLPVNTIRMAFQEQGRRVTTALRTQIGDAARLGECRLECIRLMNLVEQVRSHSLSFA
jgi:hypothetical protein